MLGLIAVLVVGIFLIGYGALSDRAKNRRAVAEMLSPPQRDIPAFDPATPAPQYLSELQARRPPEGAANTELTPEQRRELAQQLTEPSTVVLEAVMVSRDFVTDSHAGWAVLDSPRVLVCPERVEAVRELLPVLEAVKAAGVPLVIAAPFLGSQVESTLEVNAIQQTLRVVGVTASQPVVHQIAAATGTNPIGRGDLQSGYVSLAQLGTCARWVSDNRRSYVLPASRVS